MQSIEYGGKDFEKKNLDLYICGSYGGQHDRLCRQYHAKQSNSGTGNTAGK